MFTEVFWGANCRKFASEWDGTGLDSSLVDAQALRKEWAKSPPDLRAYLPLQAAWLSVQPNRPARSGDPRIHRNSYPFPVEMDPGCG
jgi:hypothetical protein